MRKKRGHLGVGLIKRLVARWNKTDSNFMKKRFKLK